MNMPTQKTVRIGGACGFWGDSSLGAHQLVNTPGMQYITFDYLAELTLAIMAGMRMKNPEQGYALDFVDLMKQVLPKAKAQGIRIIANAGGLNPGACAQALSQAMEALGQPVKIGVVSGDDASGVLQNLRKQGNELKDMQSGQPAPAFVLTANAYLGAFPIAAALGAGADIVITGRVVDSAMVLGALIHEFKWTPTQLDELAQGSLAGHIVECGAQATGGLFTDWQVVPDWANIGYPFVDVTADGSFTLGKPDHTGGLINKAVASEQLLYEIGDPANYQLPDVVCDFTQVHIENSGDNRVRISGAKGKAPSGQYKVCATYPDGFRCIGLLSIVGFDAAEKAKRTAEAILERTRTQFKQLDLADYTRAHYEVIGTETDFGPHAQVLNAREAMLRIAIHHADKKAATLFSKEIAPAGTSFAPGTSGNFGMGRPNVVPLVRLFSTLIDKSLVQAKVSINGEVVEYTEPEHPLAAPPGQTSQNQASANVYTPIGRLLIDIAHGRSGDKGNTSNVGLVARSDTDWALLKAAITPERVKAYLGHLVQGSVTVYPLPGINALNVVMDQALDGGGMTSMRNDPLGKGMAQLMLTMPI
ncbi:acyclic terpene utilization AtuA family protein [Limnobacter litoralis]|uniref:Terpene utilization protein AtuA n=1 Tax=Limnobacter litoralis TaxID=481366 RepID=A0ABQ5YPM3_9BURK|nr:acyclic terpene utilization AtuA family protein [Limnobacter litoralis]GLR25402.1 terpene utilization protein AtuA [Limnobacter litoralis]